MNLVVKFLKVFVGSTCAEKESILAQMIDDLLLRSMLHFLTDPVTFKMLGKAEGREIDHCLIDYHHNFLVTYSSLSVVLQEKPDPNRVVGVKWKTPPLEGTGELPLPSISSKGKQHDEWSCAICRVSTTSEKGFTEHLGGKKHKANEARLRANILEKSSNTSTKTITLQKKLGLSNQNEKVELLNKGEKAEERFTEKKYADSFEKNQTDEVEMTPELGKKKKFKFWCDICLVGVHSEVVMETHKKGKKHIAGLLKLDKK